MNCAFFSILSTDLSIAANSGTERSDGRHVERWHSIQAQDPDQRFFPMRGQRRQYARHVAPSWCGFASDQLEVMP
ncbi:hypothetical protein [Rhizobium mesoamericanum]|uniref:hypothetical protein n=1 Tax=Rhizobium mesoamericanum TaxID=1079800 RepID=UPI000308DCBE|nr:hypothetical protein [Rhizobium mesoamericanum]